MLRERRSGAKLSRKESKIVEEIRLADVQITNKIIDLFHFILLLYTHHQIQNFMHNF